MEVDDDIMHELEEGELIDEQTATTKIDEDKKILRAKRFGIPQTETTSTDPEVAAIQKRMGVDKYTRTEALHLLGTETMKTEDVFSYFSNNKPASIEWISDNSCNVFWLDDASCAKALLENSIHIKGQSGFATETEEVLGEESIHIQDIRMTLPAGIWRKGHPYLLANNLFMRYAKYSDKKTFKQDFARKSKVFLDEGDEVAKKLRVESSNPWVDIALQWGHYEHKSAAQKAVFEAIPILPICDARELISNREIAKPKRRLRQREADNSDRDNPVEELPLGRMQADIEEEKILSQKSIANKVNTIDLRDKLGWKRKHNNDIPPSKLIDDMELRWKHARKRHRSRDWESSSDSESDSVPDDRLDLRKKLQRPSSKCKRHHSKKRLKNFVTSPLRIEIDNDVYYESANRE
ncbi:nuclear cap-binding protein subunit 3-like [Cimex lectularius]|uniref:Nuclear cap-binding protein subunit 3 n=1 Tax=Cimex lectularius TaxID=79782 RepID=A0A8I6R8L3_CIMLE|nr:nuclear cap-binding protein subunit 3-like [Cimex lectularius]